MNELTYARPMATRRMPAIIQVFFLLFPAFLGCDSSTTLGTASVTVLQEAAPNPERVPDCVVVPDGEYWLMALASPVVERLAATQASSRPALLITSHVPSIALEQTLQRLPYARTLALHLGERPMTPGNPRQAKVTWVPLADAPAEASLDLAGRFWNKPGTAVTASLRDPKGAILAGTLAAHLGAPLILHREFDSELARIRDGLESLEVRTVLAIRDGRRTTARWVEALGAGTRVLDHGSAEDRIQEHLHSAGSGTVILARTPEDADDSGRLAWLAPHWSAVRKAPVVLVDSPDPRVAEKSVFDYVVRMKTAPRTLTILATISSIGQEYYTIPTPNFEPDSGYSLPMDPCSLPRTPSALALGVGRIPSNTVSEASLIFIAGRIRESLPLDRTLMIANPAHAEGGALPLAETVSRLTVSEMRNAGVPVDEFTRIPPHSNDVIKAARHARLIIFQGHALDNTILADPEEFPMEPIPEEFTIRPDDDILFDSIAPRGPPPAPATPLERSFLGYPIFIFQSCSSLQGGYADRVFESGGAGLIGSVSSIHSASGSTFLKALIDGALHRGSTIGEALRDARNYYLTLIELKNRRGHKQQAKGLRVALSFRLWGDPELSLFPGRRPRSVLKPLTARWTPEGHLKVSVPETRLPALRNETYQASMFPSSEAAGLVKRIEGSPLRAILPIYYFRIALPREFAARKFTVLKRAGGKPNRAAFLPDSFGRFLYVVYFPVTERENGSFRLFFE